MSHGAGHGRYRFCPSFGTAAFISSRLAPPAPCACPAWAAWAAPVEGTQILIMVRVSWVAPTDAEKFLVLYDLRRIPIYLARISYTGARDEWYSKRTYVF